MYGTTPPARHGRASRRRSLAVPAHGASSPCADYWRDRAMAVWRPLPRFIAHVVSLIARVITAGWAMLLRLARLDPPDDSTGGPGQLADSSELAGPSSEPSRARALDLALLGQLLASRLADPTDGGKTGQAACFARLWARRIVPLAIGEGCTWQLGMTAMIHGLTSPAGRLFNGRVGRISDRLVGATPGEWRLTLTLTLTLTLSPTLTLKPDPGPKPEP